MKKFFPDLTYHIPRGSAGGWAAAAFMALACILRGIFWYLDGGTCTALFLVTQILLPMASCVLFIVLLLACGRHNLPLTIIPVLLGCVFFVFRAVSSLGTVHMILCLCLYAVVAVLYTLTVTGYIPTKKPLWILFAAALCWHVFAEDLPALIRGMPLRAFLPEASVLCILAALLLTTLSIVPDRTWLK